VEFNISEQPLVKKIRGSVNYFILFQARICVLVFHESVPIIFPLPPPLAPPPSPPPPPGMKWANFAAGWGSHLEGRGYGGVWVVDDDIQMPTHSVNAMFQLFFRCHTSVSFCFVYFIFVSFCINLFHFYFILFHFLFIFFSFSFHFLFIFSSFSLHFFTRHCSPSVTLMSHPHTLVVFLILESYLFWIMTLPGMGGSQQ
jgi:hypothetical protein